MKRKIRVFAKIILLRGEFIWIIVYYCITIQNLSQHFFRFFHLQILSNQDNFFKYKVYRFWLIHSYVPVLLITISCCQNDNIDYRQNYWKNWFLFVVCALTRKQLVFLLLFEMFVHRKSFLMYKIIWRISKINKNSEQNILYVNLNESSLRIYNHIGTLGIKQEYDYRNKYIKRYSRLNIK